MLRRWIIEPDETGIVSQQQLAQELASCAVIIDKIGGHLRVTTHRQRSEDIPGEAFTVGVAIEWFDRTDDTRLVPEQEIEPPARAAAPPVREDVGDVAELVREPAPEQPVHPSALMHGDDDDDEALAAAARAAYAEDLGDDGIVRDGEGNPVEDLTAVPAAHR